MTHETDDKTGDDDEDKEDSSTREVNAAMRTVSSTLATSCVLCLTPNLILALASTVVIAIRHFAVFCELVLLSVTTTKMPLNKLELAGICIQDFVLVDLR